MTTSIIPGISIPSTSGSTAAAPASYASWEYQVLSDLQAPTNEINLLALHLWANSEGVNPNNNNWLATSLKGAAYPTSGVVAENGGNAIPAYNSQATGVAATVATIKGYPAIVSALQSGTSLQAIYSAINQSRWCKGCQGGHYPTALAAWVGGGNPADAAAGETNAGGASASAACAWQLGPWCVLNESQAKAALGGFMVVAGVGTIGIGLILVFAFGLTRSRAGSAATALAARAPGPVGTAAKGVRTLGGRGSGGRSRPRPSSSPPSSPGQHTAAGRHAAGGGPGRIPAREAVRRHNAAERADDNELRAQAAAGAGVRRAHSSAERRETAARVRARQRSDTSQLTKQRAG